MITPVPGIYIKLTPSFLLEAETSAGVVGTIDGCVGYSASPQDGFKNLTSAPKLDEETTEINIEGSIFVGFSLEPSISIVTEKLVKASAEAKVGLELTLSKNYLEALDNAKEKHECSNCFEGEIHAKGEISASLKFFDDESLEVSAKKEKKFKICDIYWCIQHGKFEFSSCPYHQYKVTVIAKNPDGTLVKEATVNGDFQTNSKGEAYLWFARGKHKLSISKNGKDKVTKAVDVVDKARKITVTFKTNSVVDGETDGSKDEEDSENDWLENNPLAGKKIKDISLNRYNCGILTTNGELYSWGDGIVQHRTPTKILSNVKEVQMCDSNLSVALLNNGDLYMWGYLDGTLGGECIEYLPSPTKVLSNVESFEVAGFYDEMCYALTKSHELYVWGADEMALGETPDNTKPYKVMDDVVYADIEEVDDYHLVCAAIKSTGELYMWGENDTGILGEIKLDDDGYRKTIYSQTPKKIMDHVENVKLSQGYCTALTNSGDLYTWGDNSYGQLGNGNNISTHIPQKILSDIVEYDVAGPLAGAINNNGDLYMWGNAYNIDDESDEPELILTPHKIMSKTKKLYLDTYINAVISQDNKLYTWGFDFENSEYDKILSPQYLFDDVIDCDIDLDTLGIITKKNDLYMCGGISYVYNGSYFGGIGLKKPTQINVVHPAIKTSSKKRGKVVQKTTGIPDAALFTKTSNGSALPSESFEDLDANATYNYYILKSKDTEDILSGNNLLYIGQGTTDSSGHLRTAYEMKEACDEPIILLKKLEKDNITDAKILISDLIYNKQEQYINPTVTYKGETLEEGKDYELSGDFSASEIGTYTVTICGIGNYTGLVDKTFNISCSHQFGDWIITKEPTDVDAGTKKRVCSICEYAEEETISKLPSTYGKKESKPKLPSIYGKKVKKPGKVTGLKVKNKKKNKIIVSWKWKTSVSGFQIQYAQNKKFTKKKKSKMVGGWTSLKIITKLKKGKTYYVRVRAYKKSSGKKIYGKWSKIKKIKIRK